MGFACCAKHRQEKKVNANDRGSNLFKRIIICLHFKIVPELMISNEAFKVYKELPDDFSTAQIASRKEPTRVLMCTPTYFDIVDVKNIHMEGNAENFNKKIAL